MPAAKTRRSLRRGQGTALALLLAVPGFASAAILPDGSDAPAGAQAIERLPAKATALLERPGDQDWYSILGRNPDDSVNAVFVRVLRGSCATPLRVALFNPEQRWMRTRRASVGHVATVLVPPNPSRYLVDVSVPDRACSQIEYEVTYVATARPGPDGAASKCVVARARRIDAEDRLKLLERARLKYQPDTRPRYDSYVAQATAALAAARRSVKRACG